MKFFHSGLLNGIIFLLICFLIIACNESLPPYAPPENVLAITQIVATQGTIGSGTPILNMNLIGVNQYEETFEDTINANGEVRIWWQRHPEFSATLPLSNSHFVPPTPIRGSRLILDPGDTFHMKTVWFLISDQGEYLIDLLDYSQSDVRGDFEYARPETLMIEVDLMIYRQIGMIRSDPFAFEFTGYRAVHDQL